MIASVLLPLLPTFRESLQTFQSRLTPIGLCREPFAFKPAIWETIAAAGLGRIELAPTKPSAKTGTAMPCPYYVRWRALAR
jgi:hypothetical protein